MPPITVLVVSTSDQSTQIADALAGFGNLVRIQGCRRADRLSALAAPEHVGAIVAELRDATGVSTVPTLLALRRHDENLPIIVSAALTPTGVRDVVRAAAAGLEASWVIPDVENLPAAIMRVVADRVQCGPAVILFRTAWPIIAAPAREFFAAAAIGAAHPITTAGVASALGMAVRTLERRVERAGLPPPHRVLGWCRVLHATWHLDRLGRPPKQVADQLQFPSVSALYNLLHRYAAPRPSILMTRGGFELMLRRFTDNLGPQEVLPPNRDRT